jgi:hypothetical protein
MTLACGDDLGRVNRVSIHLFFEDLSILADQKVHAAGSLILVVVDSVIPGDFSTPIAKKREGHSNLVGKGFIGERTIHAHTQDLGVGGFQLLQVLLEVFHLLGSTPGEGEDIKGEHNILLAVVIAEMHVLQVLPIEVLEAEIGSSISDL